jgi:hypothetical protein
MFRLSHNLQAVALLFALVAIIAATKSGKLKGVRLAAVWFTFGCFALGWVADSFGW